MFKILIGDASINPLLLERTRVLVPVNTPHQILLYNWLIRLFLANAHQRETRFDERYLSIFVSPIFNHSQLYG